MGQPPFSQVTRFDNSRFADWDERGASPERRLPCRPISRSCRCLPSLRRGRRWPTSRHSVMARSSRCSSTLIRSKCRSSPPEWTFLCLRRWHRLRGIGVEREALVLPSFDPTDHLLDRTTKRSEADCGLVCSVAMRTGTVDNEQGVVGILRQIALADPRMRQVDRAWQVACGEQLRTADVQHNEARGGLAQPLVYIPAVSLKAQELLKMRKGSRRLGRRNTRDRVRRSQLWHAISFPYLHALRQRESRLTHVRPNVFVGSPSQRHRPRPSVGT
jgi:hypothetical protein